MIVSVIVAMDREGGIGVDGVMPWHLSTDLQLFKHTTMGHHLIVGRKTFESIGKALPGRMMIVITRQLDYFTPGCQVAHSLDQALALAEKQGEIEAFVAGGGEIYHLALPLADRIYLTRVHTQVIADTYFPTFEPEEWRELERREYPAGEKDEYAFTYSILERTAL